LRDYRHPSHRYRERRVTRGPRSVLHNAMSLHVCHVSQIVALVPEAVASVCALAQTFRSVYDDATRGTGRRTSHFLGEPVRSLSPAANCSISESEIRPRSVATGDGGYHFPRAPRDPGTRPVAPARSLALVVMQQGMSEPAVVGAGAAVELVIGDTRS